MFLVLGGSLIKGGSDYSSLGHLCDSGVGLRTTGDAGVGTRVIRLIVACLGSCPGNPLGFRAEEARLDLYKVLLGASGVFSIR